MQQNHNGKEFRFLSHYHEKKEEALKNIIFSHSHPPSQPLSIVTSWLLSATLACRMKSAAARNKGKQVGFSTNDNKASMAQTP
jgi:hypothetical protein